MLIESGLHNGTTIFNRTSDFGENYVTVKLRQGLESLKGYCAAPYAMWVDGLDTLVLKPPHRILERVIRYESPVVISAETCCWPDAVRVLDYPEFLRERKAFINSGCFIGRTPEVMHAMQIVIDCAEDENDQRAWTKAFLAGKLEGLVEIDTHRELFACQGDWGVEWPNPCVRHWNGRTPGRAEFFTSEFLRPR